MIGVYNVPWELTLMRKIIIFTPSSSIFLCNIYILMMITMMIAVIIILSQETLSATDTLCQIEYAFHCFSMGHLVIIKSIFSVTYTLWIRFLVLLQSQTIQQCVSTFPLN